MSPSQFTDDFIFGSATAAYQIEGAAFEDGKGESTWDMMCRWPGKIARGQSGETACDHYHRYREDVALMKRANLRAYRFSISWPRVLPEGIGRINEAGVDFYDRLVDELLAAGVQPYATLFHWDYPLSLFYRGGWLNRDTADWFADYARLMVERLGDRVKHWMTFNEPQCTIILGHISGAHAPGLKLPFKETLLATHNLLLAHGKAVTAMRDAGEELSIGFVQTGGLCRPATDSPEDIEAARIATFNINPHEAPNLWNVPWMVDPVYKGGYPEDGLRIYGDDVPEIQSGDMETICQPLDFFAMNTYSAMPVRAADNDLGWEEVTRAPGYAKSRNGWPIDSDVLYWAPKILQERYGLPIIITENGISMSDFVMSDGKVHDPHRCDYIKRFLTSINRAIADGVDIRGYFHWSFMDNFEWSHGYDERFGLVHVDYETLKRTPKDSLDYYARIIATNGEALFED